MRQPRARSARPNAISPRSCCSPGAHRQGERAARRPIPAAREPEEPASQELAGEVLLSDRRLAARPSAHRARAGTGGGDPGARTRGETSAKKRCRAPLCAAARRGRPGPRGAPGTRRRTGSSCGAAPASSSVARAASAADSPCCKCERMSETRRSSPASRAESRRPCGSGGAGRTGAPRRAGARR